MSERKLWIIEYCNGGCPPLSLCIFCEGTMEELSVALPLCMSIRHQDQIVPMPDLKLDITVYEAEIELYGNPGQFDLKMPDLASVQSLDPNVPVNRAAFEQLPPAQLKEVPLSEIQFCEMHWPLVFGTTEYRTYPSGCMMTRPVMEALNAEGFANFSAYWRVLKLTKRYSWI